MIPTTFALVERIEVGGVAPVGAVSGQLGKIAVLLQICQRPLDGAAGEVQILLTCAIIVHLLSECKRAVSTKVYLLICL